MTQPQQQSDYRRAVAEAAALYISAKAGREQDSGVIATASTAALLLLMFRASSQLKTRWREIDPYDDTEVTEFAAAAGKIVTPVQKVVATQAAATQSLLLRGAGLNVTVRPRIPTNIRSAAPDGTIKRRPPVRVTYSAPQGGVTEHSVPQASSDTAEVFARPAVTYRFRRSEDATHEQATAAAEERIDTILDGNLQAVRAKVEFQAMQQAQTAAVDLDRTIVGYRRVIHPELSIGGVCGMCIVAANRVYKIETLKAIHHRCHCTVMVKFEDYDPGNEMNRDDLRRVYAGAGGTSRDLLKKVRYKVEEHSELGPMLVPVKGGPPVPYFSVPADPAA